MTELRRLLGLTVGAWMFAANAGEPSAEDILSGTAPPLDYSQSVKCIASFKIERTQPLSERYIVFHLSGDELWLAQLRTRCPGLSPNSHVSFEKDANRLCEWDSVRVVYDEGLSVRLGPRCNLPKFEQVSKEQVEMLQQQIKTARHPPVEANP